MNETDKSVTELITKIEAELVKTGVPFTEGFRFPFVDEYEDAYITLALYKTNSNDLSLQIEQRYNGGATFHPLVQADTACKLQFLLVIDTFITVYYKHVKRQQMTEEQILLQGTVGLELIEKLNAENERAKRERACIR